MNDNRWRIDVKAQRWILALVVLGVAAISVSAQPTKNTATDSPNSGDFFIISSVDLAKEQLLLKLPTEVTELIRVDDNTRYFDEHGKPAKLVDLPAGDTVYVTSKRSADQPLAAKIRQGPMTLDVLRRRYLGKK